MQRKDTTPITKMSPASSDALVRKPSRRTPKTAPMAIKMTTKARSKRSVVTTSQDVRTQIIHQETKGLFTKTEPADIRCDSFVLFDYEKELFHYRNLRGEPVMMELSKKEK